MSDAETITYEMDEVEDSLTPPSSPPPPYPPIILEEEDPTPMQEELRNIPLPKK